jgi:hypothetical protein
MTAAGGGDCRRHADPVSSPNESPLRLGLLEGGQARRPRASSKTDQKVGSGKELPATPNLEPARFRIHFDEDKFFGGMAAADVRIPRVVPVLHLEG